MTTSANDIAKAINQFHTEMERLHLSVKIRLLSANPNDYRRVKATINMLNAYVYLGYDILGVPFVEDADVPSKMQAADALAQTGEKS